MNRVVAATTFCHFLSLNASEQSYECKQFGLHFAKVSDKTWSANMSKCNCGSVSCACLHVG